MCSWATAFGLLKFHDDIANILVSKQYLQSSFFIPFKDLFDCIIYLLNYVCYVCFQVCFVFETLYNVGFY